MRLTTGTRLDTSLGVAVGQRPPGVDHLEATPVRATGAATDRPGPTWLGGFLLIALFAQLLVEWRRAHRTTISEVPA